MRASPDFIVYINRKLFMLNHFYSISIFSLALPSLFYIILYLQITIGGQNIRQNSKTLCRIVHTFSSFARCTVQKNVHFDKFMCSQELARKVHVCLFHTQFGEI